MHFVEALLASGATVTATFTRSGPDAYPDSLARQRIQRLLPHVEVRWNTSFGNPKWMQLLKSGDFHLLCAHGAAVGNYRNPDFPVDQAVAANTRNLESTLDLFGRNGGRGVVLTGSYFEPGEGEGTRPRRAFSPYALSKARTAAAYRAACRERSLPLAKYVLPNPFGPLEKPNFSSYLVHCWLRGETPLVRTPDTVRDNVAITVLAADYARFALQLAGPDRPRLKRNPSGWVESNLDFARRLARALRPRLGRSCPVRAAPGSRGAHPPGEPPARYNTDSLPAPLPQFWDDLARFYL